MGGLRRAWRDGTRQRCAELTAQLLHAEGELVQLVEREPWMADSAHAARLRMRIALLELGVALLAPWHDDHEGHDRAGS